MGGHAFRMRPRPAEPIPTTSYGPGPDTDCEPVHPQQYVGRVRVLGVLAPPWQRHTKASELGGLAVAIIYSVGTLVGHHAG